MSKKILVICVVLVQCLLSSQVPKAPKLKLRPDPYIPDDLDMLPPSKIPLFNRLRRIDEAANEDEDNISEDNELEDVKSESSIGDLEITTPKLKPSKDPVVGITRFKLPPVFSEFNEMIEDKLIDESVNYADKANINTRFQSSEYADKADGEDDWEIIPEMENTEEDEWMKVENEILCRLKCHKEIIPDHGWSNTQSLTGMSDILRRCLNECS